MNSRERWLAALDLKPVDRLPFWPKLFGGYAQAQGQPFAAMDVSKLQEWIGSDDHSWLPAPLRVTFQQGAVESSSSGDTHVTTYRSGSWQTRLVQKYDKPSDSNHPVEYPINSVEDIKRMMDVFAGAKAEPDLEAGERARQKAAANPNAVWATGSATSPLMEFLRYLAPFERAHEMLIEHPAEMAALFDAMHALALAKVRVVCEHTVADIVYMIEDTSTTMVSPTQFRQYCVPPLKEYARLAKQAGKRMVLHMCGHLKGILADLATLPVAGYEAYTSPTVGDATLADGRAAMPQACFIGGTNAAMWLRPAGEIIAALNRDLDALPHHRGIVVTSGGVMPPACRPETIREVCRFVREYPARN